MTDLPREPTIVVRGAVSSTLVAYALEKFEKVAAGASAPILGAVLRLEHYDDPARRRSNQVQASLSVNGRDVRAHRSAEAMTEAVDLTMDRMRRQVDAAGEKARSRALRHRDPSSWHHDDHATNRPVYYPRPVNERAIVRRKTFAVGPESVEEALFDLELLDHDFFLFVNEATNEDNVVYRDGADYGIIQPSSTADVVARLELPIRQGRAPAPLSLSDACEVLDATDAPFVFYIEPESKRGRVVYRRYDGDYGLVTPADSDDHGS